MQHPSLLLISFFSALEEGGIVYSVMGDTRDLPAEIASDVDIIVPQHVVPSLPQFMDTFCKQHGARLVQCLQHEHNAYYFVLALTGTGDRPEFLAIDLCGDYFRHGRKLLDAGELLATVTPAVDTAGHAKCFTVCAPAFEFCYYLIKKIDKEALNSRHGEHLSSQWRLDPHGGKRMIERFWGESAESRLLMRAAESGDWTTVAKLVPRMCSALRRRIPKNLSDTLLEWGRRSRRFREPTGLLIGALGPDGSGKSSVIAAVDRQVQPAFRATALVHLRPGFLYRPERMPSKTPHAERPRTGLRSLIKLLFFASDYILGYLFVVRPLLVRSNGLMFDRYYDDLLADPVRYRHHGSLPFARWLRNVVPRPHLWLLFDAPADVLQSRKQEVTPAESERQRFAYRALLRDQRNVAVLDAGRPLAEVIRDATDAVLAACEERTRTRLGLAPAAASSPLSARWLRFCCRHRIPLVSKLTRLLFNSDIYCKVPADLCMPHPYGIIIHSQTRIGCRVTVMQQVTLGGKDLHHNVAPIIGDDVYIGAGARVLGNVTIGNGAMIGANAVVTRDVPANAKVVGANRIIEAVVPPAVETAIEPAVIVYADEHAPATEDDELRRTVNDVVGDGDAGDVVLLLPTGTHQGTSHR